MNRIVLLLICLLTLASAKARRVIVDGLCYYLYSETREAVIDSDNSCSGELDIPSKVTYEGQAYTVKGMSWQAFANCTGLTKVKIPKTIDHIVHHVLSDEPNVAGAVSPMNMNPFTGCTALESIYVDEGNPSMKSVGDVLFSKDGTSLYCYPAGLRAKSYVVPDGVVSIGICAFAGNVYLESVSLPERLTALSGGVFEDCSQLRHINLPNGLTHLEAFSFRNCSSLPYMDIPSTVTSIGEYVFAGCSSLTSITIPESVTYIGGQLFFGNEMETILIKGLVNKEFGEDGVKHILDGLNPSAVIYTQPSEVERFQRWFAGSVKSLSSLSVNGVTSSGNVSPVVYDLQGRRLSGQPQRGGVYIQNGRKVLK